MLRDLPTGSTIHNLELRPGAGGTICRAAGTSATLVKNGDDGLTLIMLPSGTRQCFTSHSHRITALIRVQECCVSGFFICMVHPPIVEFCVCRM